MPDGYSRNIGDVELGRGWRMNEGRAKIIVAEGNPLRIKLIAETGLERNELLTRKKIFVLE